MEIKIPVIYDLKSTGWYPYNETETKKSIERYIKNEIAPIMLSANSDLLLEIDRELVSQNDEKSYKFNITFVINKDVPSYFSVLADNMLVMRAVEDIIREIIISKDTNESKEIMRLVEPCPPGYLPKTSMSINPNDAELKQYIGTKVYIVPTDPSTDLADTEVAVISSENIIPPPEIGNIYVSEDLKKFVDQVVIVVSNTDIPSEKNI